MVSAGFLVDLKAGTVLGLGAGEFFSWDCFGVTFGDGEFLLFGLGGMVFFSGVAGASS
jgi:hypothetical protein